MDDLFRQAVAHYDGGRMDLAQADCARILADQPDHEPALRLRAVLACLNGRFAEGADLAGRAVAVDPGNAQGWEIQGDAFDALGQPVPAAECFAQACRLLPRFGHLWGKLGLAQMAAGQVDAARQSLEQSVSLSPDLGPAWLGLARSRAAAKMVGPAMDAYAQVVALSPDNAQAWLELGNMQVLAGIHLEALSSYRQASRLLPDRPAIYSNMAICLEFLGKPDEAMALHTHAVDMRTDNPLAHLNRAVLRLRMGDLAQGWPEYEWRWQVEDAALGRPRTYDIPEWQGQDLAGKTIILHGEQGFGDAIQFCRYATVLARSGARVILDVHAALVDLLRTVPGVAQVISNTDPLPHADYVRAMMGVPTVLGTTLDTIPADIPYLHPDAAIAARWQQRLASNRVKRVGVVWAGNPDHGRDQYRSVAASGLLPVLARVPGVQVFSLQRGLRAGDDTVLAGLGPCVIDLAPLLTDFSQTAAVLSAIDLLISVDTSVAHLAGAVGCPVWMLVPDLPDWRWLLGREDSPWYPGMRLFRQQGDGRWDPVLDRLSGELTRWVGQAAPR